MNGAALGGSSPCVQTMKLKKFINHDAIMPKSYLTCSGEVGCASLCAKCKKQHKKSQFLREVQRLQFGLVPLLDMTVHQIKKDDVKKK